MISARIEKLREQMKALGLDSILISNRSNIRYLSGFTGSSALIYLGHNQKVLITDFRYIEQATLQCPEFEIFNQTTKGLIGAALEIAKNHEDKHIGFESDHTNYSTYLSLKEHDEFVFVPTKEIVENLRQVKDASEIEKLKQAEHIGDLAFEHIIPFIQREYKKGLTETDIALELERFMRMQGASGNSFNPIIAAGSKSSLCHAVPGKETLHEGDFLVMDFGCIYEGYCSDMTRTVVIGQPSPKHIEIYETVLKAQQEALAAIKSGVKGKEIDAVARKVITDAGYGEYFGHGLGHSVGIDIHENPRFSTAEERTIEEGMVLTVEPGIYLPGFGGVRIEDMVVVTKEGIENLTHSKKELIIIE